MSKSNKKDNKTERLDKIIASQGLVSRSEVKQLVKNREVVVNGVIVTDPGLKVSYNDSIAVNGVNLSQSRYTYIMLNKPRGVVSASEDKRDKTVVDILPDELKRKNLFPAGRLDKDTTGFCLITDDGEFAHDILSPNHHVTKTYIAEVSVDIDFEKAKKAFIEGVVLADGTVLLSALLEKMSGTDRHVFKVVIKEGKYHQVKRMFASLGTTVISLKRIAIGGLELDETLSEGDARLLTAVEIESIVKNDGKI
ncbi:MAG: rRNA pseudouridine synthase [Clostridia bacterium]|nr:rRNA pseudouridine synthase [Clostridia bacterium]